MSAAPTVSHPLCARLYAKQANGAEAKGLAEQRRAMLDGVAGSVVEIGAGNGLNFGHYPPAVTVVHAFEPDPYLRPLAAAAAAEAPVSISVGDAAAEDPSSRRRERRRRRRVFGPLLGQRHRPGRRRAPQGPSPRRRASLQRACRLRQTRMASAPAHRRRDALADRLRRLPSRPRYPCCPGAGRLRDPAGEALWLSRLRARPSQEPPARDRASRLGHCLQSPLSGQAGNTFFRLTVQP